MKSLLKMHFLRDWFEFLCCHTTIHCGSATNITITGPFYYLREPNPINYCNINSYTSTTIHTTIYHATHTKPLNASPTYKLRPVAPCTPTVP